MASEMGGSSGSIDASFDVVVVGGGPAGAAAAQTLVRDGRSVLVVDDRIGPRSFRVGEGAPPGLDRTVDDIFGSGTFVAADHLPSYGNRAQWGSDQAVDTDFVFNPFGSGWHLDRVAFDDRLLDVARRAGTVVWRGTVRSDADRQRSRWLLAVDTNAGRRTVAAAIVCDASGRRAAFARRHGGHLVVHDRLTAVVAVCEQRASTDDPALLEPRDTTTTVEAVESGWWYTSAIPGDRRVVALLTDGDLVAPELRTLDGFQAHLRATDLVASTLDDCGTRPGTDPVVVAAGTAQLVQPVGAGWLAAGDAAACFDPLSSQGILTALLMGRTAGDAAISLLVDPAAGTEAYEERYRKVIARFHTEHRETYLLEHRWPDSPFWSRRHTDATP